MSEPEGRGGGWTEEPVFGDEGRRRLEAPRRRANRETLSIAVGNRVRARLGDPDHHTRVPRYVRGHTGEVVAVLGEWALPDDSVRGVTTMQTCYAVRFAAAELWGSGDHLVTVDLWESYLERA